MYSFLPWRLPVEFSKQVFDSTTCFCARRLYLVAWVSCRFPGAGAGPGPVSFDNGVCSLLDVFNTNRVLTATDIVLE